MAIDIATKIRALIDARGIADATLARALGVSSTAIRRWTLRPDEYRQGESVRRPTVPQLLALARFFGVSMEYLADPEMEQPEGGLTPEERAVLGFYRVQRKVEEAAGQEFPPEELGWRIAAPRYADGPMLPGVPGIAKMPKGAPKAGGQGNGGGA